MALPTSLNSLREHTGAMKTEKLVSPKNYWDSSSNKECVLEWRVRWGKMGMLSQQDKKSSYREYQRHPTCVISMFYDNPAKVKLQFSFYRWQDGNLKRPSDVAKAVKLADGWCSVSSPSWLHFMDLSISLITWNCWISNEFWTTRMAASPGPHGEPWNSQYLPTKEALKLLPGGRTSRTSH